MNIPNPMTTKLYIIIPNMITENSFANMRSLYNLKCQLTHVNQHVDRDNVNSFLRL